MGSARPRDPASQSAQVVASYGRRFLVETAGGETLACVARGRRTGIVCGDRVRICRSSEGEGVVESVEPRSALLYRSDARREKAIAANVSQVAVVLAVAPAPHPEFIDRCLVAAEHAQVPALLLLNKADLADLTGNCARLLERYARLGYRTLKTSRCDAVDSLLEQLRGHVSVLIGASGVGKSTLVNRLVPAAAASVGSVSAVRDAGRHTTTRAQLYRIDASSALIDSPGMQAFGLGHVPPDELAHAFVEFRPALGHCRFSNCRHDEEPNCAIDALARQGKIDAERLLHYRRILRSRNER
jgi:ribosome biogenesis GTPase